MYNDVHECLEAHPFMHHPLMSHALLSWHAADPTIVRRQAAAGGALPGATAFRGEAGPRAALRDSLATG